jgi:hypothetical protein
MSSCSADFLFFKQVCGFGPIRRRKTADRENHGLRYMILSLDDAAYGLGDASQARSL